MDLTNMCQGGLRSSDKMYFWHWVKVLFKSLSHPESQIMACQSVALLPFTSRDSLVLFCPHRLVVSISVILTGYKCISH